VPNGMGWANRIGKSSCCSVRSSKISRVKRGEGIELPGIVMRLSGQVSAGSGRTKPRRHRSCIEMGRGSGKLLITGVGGDLRNQNSLFSIENKHLQRRCRATPNIYEATPPTKKYTS